MTELTKEAKAVLNALRSALIEIQKHFPLPVKPSKIAKFYEVPIYRHTHSGAAPRYGHNTPYYDGSTRSIHLPQPEEYSPSGNINEHDEFLIGHELAHHFCQVSTGSPYVMKKYWWFELYAEAFACILTGNRSFVYVSNVESGERLLGRDASCRLTIAIVNICKLPTYGR